MGFVYYEGAFLPEHAARLPITDRGFLFGDGAYATIQVREGEPLLLDMHLTRLEEQCRAFHLLMPPLDPEAIAQLIRLNGAEKGIWRLKIIVTGGDGSELYLPERSGRILMTLHPFSPPAPEPLRVGIFPHSFHLCHASYKSLAHLNRLYVMHEAHRQGVDDCLTLTEGGIVLETAFGNLCWVVDTTLYTPSRRLPLYFGVTIMHTIEQVKRLGYRVEEVTCALQHLPDEATYYRTNSMGGIRPICEIGGKQKGHSSECPLIDYLNSSGVSSSRDQDGKIPIETSYPRG